MIDPKLFDPLMARARSKDVSERTECALLGMTGVIDTYFAESPVPFAVRRFDGLSEIDLAARIVRQSWRQNEVVLSDSERHLVALLQACASWAAGEKAWTQGGMDRRAAAVADLAWRAAWCFSCSNYARHAHDRITTNRGATSLEEPVAVNAPEGHPYHFDNSGYTFEIPRLPHAIYRGDTRSPAVIERLGFRPKIEDNRPSYAPWFGGHAVCGTISTTPDAGLAINAVNAAAVLKLSSEFPGQGGPPRCLGDGAVPRGYVYLMSIPDVPGTRMSWDVAAKEYVYLAIPPRQITSWWAVMANRNAYGPFGLADLDRDDLDGEWWDNRLNRTGATA